MDIPAPDHSRIPRFVPELQLVEFVCSEDGYARVAITKDHQGLFRLHPERWDISDFFTTGHAFWNGWGHGASLTDDIEIARQMARELLPSIPRSQVVPE